MVTLTYHQFHLPELCTCASHRNKVFLKSTQSADFPSHAEAFRTIQHWNRSVWPCWQYAPVSVDNT